MMHNADFSTFLQKLEKIFCYFKLLLYLCHTETTTNLYTMSNYIYTMVFFLPQDKEDFITCSKGKRLFKIVTDVDRRTIRIQFRKGTKAERMFNLADLWNAEIMWGK